MTNFKTKLAKGEPLLGTFVKTTHYHNTEVLAHTELDTLCLDAEHAPFGRSDLDACVMAARSKQMNVLIRIPNDHHDTILNALDIGADGIVIPHVKSAQQLEQAIANSYYGHNGRGYAGSTRMAQYTTANISQNLAHNKNNTSIIAQIEDLDALNELDAICQVAGLDCLFIGRMDLTVALGETNANAPKVIETVEHIVAVAHKHKVTTGMFIANLDELEGWIEKGVSLFLLGSDHSFMLAGARQLKARFDEACKA